MADIIEEDIKHVYTASKNGDIDTIRTVLCKHDYNLVRRLLRHVTVEDENQEATPLFAAILNEKENVVQLILENWPVDLEQCVTMTIEQRVIQGIAALWCASHIANFEIVKLLVEHGADVNHCTKSNSSPVRVACFDCDLEIIKYLVQHGADINIANEYATTGLHVAAELGRGEVVQFLLEQGINVDLQSTTGDTALNYAARKGRLDVVKFLVTNGAKQLQNNNNLTPLLSSANTCKNEVVDYLISALSLSREQKIEGLELLGASYEKSPNIDTAYKYLSVALQEREKSPVLPVPQKISKLRGCLNLDVYSNIQECKTVQELSRLKGNEHSFFVHSLYVRERILGPSHIKLVDNMEYIGATLADNGDYQTCIDLWLHVISILKENKHSTAKRLLGMSEVFAEMLQKELHPDFHQVHKVLQSGIDEISAELGEKKIFLLSDKDCPVFSFLYCLFVALKVKKTDLDSNALRTQVIRLVNLRVRFDNDYTPLHVVLDPFIEIDDFRVNKILEYPSKIMCEILVECGSNVNARDNLGNTPLHVLALRGEHVPFAVTASVVCFLIKNNAHVDVTNFKGLIPEGCATMSAVKAIFQSHRMVSLKCLASSAVMKNKISFKGEIPRALEAFVLLH